MQIGRRRCAVLALLAIVLAWLPSCGPKRPAAVSGRPTGGSATGSRTPSEGARPGDTGPDVRPVDADSTRAEDFTASDPVTMEGGPLADVHFDYDQSALSDEARGVLEKHALWIQSHREAKITVEGHCDERGTAEYNLALGDERARSTRDYLVKLGVAGDRLKTVSYGKERPLDTGNNEAAWARNRRAHFVVTR